MRRQVKFGDPNNFAMETAASLIEQFSAITGGVFLAMVVISSVGLMIGGIGVMNIMLVSVTERTREIGIRKAIGAKQSDILLQFLIEAATLTGFGGVVRLAYRLASDIHREIDIARLMCRFGHRSRALARASASDNFRAVPGMESGPARSD